MPERENDSLSKITRLWRDLKMHLRPRILGPDRPTSPQRDALITRLSQPRRQEIKQALTISSTSLGITVASLIFFPPLKIACLPMLVYLGMRPARRAYETLRAEGRIGIDLAETTAIAVSIAQPHYLISSLALSLYYLGQFVDDHKQKDYHTQAIASPQRWARLLWAEREVLTPVDHLCAGDTIVVDTGEMIPVAGVITDGTAWIHSYNRSDFSPPPPNNEEPCQIVVAGQRVETNCVVQLGHIHICVESKT